MSNVFGQDGFDVRFAWGYKGIRDAVEREDVIVIVDVLSFSSATAAANACGAAIYPFPMKDRDRAAAFALEVGAELKSDAFTGTQRRRALSPLAFSAHDHGRSYVLCSPNGATCARIAAEAPAVLIGALVNATATAQAAQVRASRQAARITVVACGERWRDAKDGEDVLRPCVEDYLGAGAVLSRLQGDLSPEAVVARTAFGGVRDRLEAVVWDCASGRELREAGYGDDVEFCAQVDSLDVVPVLDGSRFVSERDGNACEV